MTESTLDKLADAVLKLTELHVQLFERLDQMDRTWRQAAYDQPIEVGVGVDSYPFREQFDRLCSEVADMRRLLQEARHG